ncbi:hypothetical protein BOTBODRAFT_231037 [Botryobasidium botryosum FD-172 SS1]|uniref:Uncharacterized protein n=1 Tax=Botryobasidium botryosum (strain FD-172 SS1) TaxID=930990 RepID=A0A067M500_BOTB1|nr:hypothetical protein BOTBODRAFT_231037 [Botryobasidium botryosum FD-172 SS1]
MCELFYSLSVLICLLPMPNQRFHPPPLLTLIMYHQHWVDASMMTARACQRGSWLASRLRKWAHTFVSSGKLPCDIYGTWNRSVLKDEDFKQELLLHLQGIGKYVRAQDIVDYPRKADVMAQIGRTKPISLATAQRWMRTAEYRWKKASGGQYIDGHERDDVVTYRQTIFLPTWAEFLLRTRQFIDGKVCFGPPRAPGYVVIWNHDESTFYANNRRKIRWVHVSVCQPWRWCV